MLNNRDTSGVICTLLFCARISVTHIDQKENISYRRAERKLSEIFGFGCVEHKLHYKKNTYVQKNKQTDMTTKYYQILPSEGTDVDCCTNGGGNSSENLRLQILVIR